MQVHSLLSVLQTHGLTQRAAVVEHIVHPRTAIGVVRVRQVRVLVFIEADGVLDGGNLSFEKVFPDEAQGGRDLADFALDGCGREVLDILVLLLLQVVLEVERLELVVDLLVLLVLLVHHCLNGDVHDASLGRAPLLHAAFQLGSAQVRLFHQWAKFLALFAHLGTHLLT